MTDTVSYSNRWVSKDNESSKHYSKIDFSVYNDNILHINPKEMHIWNKPTTGTYSVLIVVVYIYRLVIE